MSISILRRAMNIHMSALNAKVMSVSAELLYDDREEVNLETRINEFVVANALPDKYEMVALCEILSYLGGLQDHQEVNYIALSIYIYKQLLRQYSTIHSRLLSGRLESDIRGYIYANKSMAVDNKVLHVGKNVKIVQRVKGYIGKSLVGRGIWYCLNDLLKMYDLGAFYGYGMYDNEITKTSVKEYYRGLPCYEFIDIGEVSSDDDTVSEISSAAPLDVVDDILEVENVVVEKDYMSSGEGDETASLPNDIVNVNDSWDELDPVI